MMSLRRWWTLWYIVLIRLRGGRLGRGRYVATDAVVLPQYGRILAGHCTIAHIFLVAIAVGWLAGRIVDHATAQDLIANG